MNKKDDSALDRMAENARELGLDYEPAQQEPVAWVCEASSSDEKHAIDYWPGDIEDIPIGTKLYTSPQPSKPWIGLTEEDRVEIWKKSSSIDGAINATATKLREKNAQPSKPLTDEQIEQCMKQAYATVQGRNLEHAFARAIEAAHGITGEQR